MKTSEFIKKVEDLGLIVEPERSMMSDESATLDCMHIYRHGDSFPVTSVGIDQAYEIDTLKTNFESYSETDSAKLWKLLIEFAATPIADRKVEPTFYVRILTGNNGWLNWNEETGELGANTRYDHEKWHAGFTEKQYNQFRNMQSALGFKTLPAYDPDNKDVFVPVEVDE